MSDSNGSAASSEVARRSPLDIESPVTGGEMETLYRLADGLSKSGFFKDAKQSTQAFAKLIFGRDLGLSATQAMTDIHIVEGKPEMSANLQASKVLASGRYAYRILEHDDKKCSIEFGPAPAPAKAQEWKDAFGVSTFTIEDAKRAGLVHKTSGGHDGMWEKYPRNMLFARAISNGVAWFCPDVMNGIRVYAEGEIAETRPAAVEVEQVPPEAEIVTDEAAEGVGDEERQQLADALDAAGLDENERTMLLTAVGVDSVDDLTPATLDELRQRIAERVAGGAS